MAEASAAAADENADRSGTLLCAYKGKKAKKFMCHLSGSRLELFENEKSLRKNQPPKLSLQIATCFSILKKLDAKQKCTIYIYSNDDCLQLKAESEAETDVWHSALSAQLQSCRQGLARNCPDFEEITRPLYECEHVWEVTVKSVPKDPDDLCKRLPDLSGPRRFCLTPTSLVLYKKGAPFPPENDWELVDFPRIHVSNYGMKDKLFFIRVGRSAVTGSGQLWLQTESPEIGSKIHEILREISERQREARERTMSELEPRTRSAWGSQGAASTLRDRAATQPHRDRAASMGEQKLQSHRKILEHGYISGSPRHTFSKPVVPSPLSGQPSLTTPPSAPPALSGSVGALHLPMAWKPDALSSPTQNPPESPPVVSDRSASPRLGRVPLAPAAPCIHEEDYTMMDRGDQEEGSGDTLTLPAPEPVKQPQPVEPTEDYVEMVTESDSSAYMEMDSSRAESDEMVLSDYTPMGQGTPPISGSADQLTLPSASWQSQHQEEVRSYISDSSGYWSAGGGPIRAHSFGPRCAPHIKRPGSTDDRKTTTPALSVPDDPRKRAYSLGSKSWAVRSTSLDDRHHMSVGLYRLAETAMETCAKGMAPFRKISASKLSSSSHTPSDSGDLRGRSESFGSAGRFTPLGKRLHDLHGVRQQNEDLMELDFGGPSPQIGRSPSGSLASSESPSRSRTSSFGAKTQIPTPSLHDRPSDKLIAQFLQEKHPSFPQGAADFATLGIVEPPSPSPDVTLSPQLSEMALEQKAESDDYSQMIWCGGSEAKPEPTIPKPCHSPILPTVDETDKPISFEASEYAQMDWEQPSQSAYAEMTFSAPESCPAPVARSRSPKPLPTVQEDDRNNSNNSITSAKVRHPSGPPTVQSAQRHSAPVLGAASPSQQFVAAHVTQTRHVTDLDYATLDLKPTAHKSSDGGSSGSSSPVARLSSEQEDATVYVSIDPNETAKRVSRN